MKQQIEIDVPDGKRVTDIIPYRDYIRLELEPIPKTKRRPPTKLDLLGVDSIPCWVRDSGGAWSKSTLIAVASDVDKRYFTKAFAWRYCEIEAPADEQPLRECWVNYYDRAKPDPWGTAYANRDDAVGYAVHMIEVRP